IHRLERCALVETAVADERHSDAAGLERFCRKRGATDKWRTSTHDPVGTHHPLGHVGDVHRSALASAKTAFAPVYLFHHRLHITSLGDTVAVSPMGARDIVHFGQIHAHADRTCLLAGVEVNESWYFAAGEFAMNAVFELPDRAHLMIRCQ